MTRAFGRPRVEGTKVFSRQKVPKADDVEKGKENVDHIARGKRTEGGFDQSKKPL